MKTVLETERLILRELNVNDAQNFYELNSNPNVIKYTGDEAFKNISEAADFLENYKDYEINGYGRWAVINRQTNKFVGWCGLKFSKEKNETDIGFRFFENEWNKGFATESAKACLDYGFENLNLDEITGNALKANKASIKVLEKIGLRYLKDEEFHDGEGVIYKIKNPNKSN